MGIIQKTIEIVILVLGALIAALGIGALLFYTVFMVMWIHIPLLDMLTFVIPAILVVIGLVWACNKARIAIQRRNYAPNRV